MVNEVLSLRVQLSDSLYMPNMDRVLLVAAVSLADLEHLVYIDADYIC